MYYKMTGCAAINCNNSSEKRVKMFYFPSDPDQRAVWIIKVGRQNWVPNKHSALCEYHFVKDAFEKERVDGTKKLKRHAIPTIFGDLVIQISSQRKKHKKGETEANILTEEPMIKAENVEPVTESVNVIYQYTEENAYFPQEANISIEEPMIKAENVEPVTESVNVIHQCTEENAYFPQEANTSTVTVITCSEDSCEKETSTLILKTHALNNKIDEGQCIKCEQLYKKCDKFEQLYKKCEKSKIQIKRIHKQKEMAFKRKIKTLQQVKETTLEKELLMHSLQTQFKQ